MAEKPTAAFVLSLIGAIFYILAALVIVAAISTFGFLIPFAGIAVVFVGGLGLISGVVMIVGAAMMNSSDKGRVRTGSILVLVFCLIGAIFTAGGFFIGFILALIGSILGLVWKPPVMAPPPPSPPPA